MIYYFPGLDHPVPSGGVATHYEHVRHLVALGIDAAILHVQPGFRPTWFDLEVPIRYVPDTELGPNDLLVINEIMGPNAADIARGIRKIVFLQNIHYVFRGYPIPPTTPAPYTDPEIVATMVLTETERDFFKWVWPDHPVHVVKHGYDIGKWPLGREKKRQIAYMPRKHADEAQQVFGYLHARGDLEGWNVVAIDGQTQAETSRILQESAMFFAFGYPEGGTKPPFEAMLSGCVVVGYGGFASDADLVKCGGILVPSGDTCRFAREADAVLRNDWEWLTERGRKVSEWTLDAFPLSGERNALLAVMRPLLEPVAV